MSFNKTILIGRLTADPEQKQTQAGQSIVTPCVALNEGKDKATFVNFSAFDKNAEFISRYFRKGDPIGIEGRVTSRKVERDGKNYTELGIVCERAFFVESARNDQGGIISPSDHPSATQAKNGAYMPTQYGIPMPSKNTSNANYEEIPITDSDLPF